MSRYRMLYEIEHRVTILSRVTISNVSVGEKDIKKGNRCGYLLGFEKGKSLVDGH